MKHSIALLALVLLSACGGSPDQARAPQPLPPVDSPQADGGNVRGRAIVTVSSEQEMAMLKMFNNFLMPMAYASTATTVVTYNLAAAVNFVVNVAGFVPGSFSGLNLNLGSFTITTLKDNNLEVCGPLADTQCVNAYLRVYTTGSMDGFVNTTHSPNYGVPVYTSGLNPAVPVPLNAPGMDIKNVLAMSPTKHVVNLVDFVTTNYTVKTDFANAGYGSYSMTYVLEYSLSL